MSLASLNRPSGWFAGAPQVAGGDTVRFGLRGFAGQAHCVSASRREEHGQSIAGGVDAGHEIVAPSVVNPLTFLMSNYLGGWLIRSSSEHLFPESSTQRAFVPVHLDPVLASISCYCIGGTVPMFYFYNSFSIY